MARVSWLPTVLRSAGIEVVELAGWRGRGIDRLNPQGIVCHHTATGPSSADANVAGLLRDGRPDLAGPLCQLGLDRRGRVWMIADGRGNHNGFGTWGNDAIGIEAFNTGTGERWAPAQLEAYQQMCAAICRHLGWPATRVMAHRETDPKRKIDPTGIDMHAFRVRVSALINPRRPIGGLELTVGQYEDIVGLLVEIRNAIVGHDDKSRDESVYWNARYLRSELLSGDNLAQLRSILERYGNPAVTLVVGDAADADNSVLVVRESEDERTRNLPPPGEDRRRRQGRPE